MSLATRLSGFFLVALALVLGGFSVTLYLLARTHFQRDLDERLTTALDALRRRCARTRTEVEWKPGERPDIAGLHPQDEPVRWAVFDVRGRALDHSWDIRPQDLTVVSSLSPDAGHVHDEFTDQSGRQWRLVVRRIQSSGGSSRRAGSGRRSGGRLVTTRGTGVATADEVVLAGRGVRDADGADGGQPPWRGADPGRSLHRSSGSWPRSWAVVSAAGPSCR